MTPESSAAGLASVFRTRYGRPARLYRAPGRVNLIGEHTDYNLGYVMPAAIRFSAWAAISPRADRLVRVYSETFAEEVQFPLDGLRRGPTGHWSDYIRGMAGALMESGLRLSGADLAVASDVPVGAGLSSSAALEIATGYALLEASGLPVERWALARAARSAEHHYVGTRCGIMDQFASCFGEEGRALLLDCRSLEYKALPLPAGAALVVCDTKVKHSLAGGEYNRRRAECEEGVALLAARGPGIESLRDVSPERLEQGRGALPETIYRRCRHVVSENARALAAADALVRGDLPAFGRLMDQSHASLRDDFEVSCPELDLLVELARPLAGVFGARMMGGGFGGCTINLVAAERAESFGAALSDGYRKATGLRPSVFITEGSAGAGPA
jgi:galactokinase